MSAKCILCNFQHVIIFCLDSVQGSGRVGCSTEVDCNVLVLFRTKWELASCFREVAA